MTSYHHAVERTIYVGNIGRSVTEQALLVLFDPCGKITNIRLAGDPTFDTRYAFIEFSYPDEVKTALLLDGMYVFEHAIRVSPARGGGPLRNNDPDRVNKTIHVAGLPMEDIEEDVLAEFFAHCGEVVAVRKNGRFAWVEFATMSGMQAALNLDGECMGNSTMKVQQSRTPIMNAGWRAQGIDLPGVDFDPQTAYQNDLQYENKFYWSNGATATPPATTQSTIPAVSCPPSYAITAGLQGGIMAPATGLGGMIGAVGSPPFHPLSMQPPPPGTGKIESEIAN
ncbi:hypothetical protein BSKO_08050 [Bryopsis sp. KO-2023]|nr:hypothetical protein BSKO_08050 [Bryopsis sp. KO-2023]